MRQNKRVPKTEILKMLDSEPGFSVTELSRALQMPRTTLSYHLKRLVENGQIAELDASERERTYTMDNTEARLRAKLRVVGSNENSVRVLDYYDHAGGSVDTLNEVAHELQLSNPTIAWHVERLKRLGLLEDRGSRAARRHALTHDGRLVISILHRNQQEPF